MVEAFTRLFFGAMSATGSAVSLGGRTRSRPSDDAEGAIVLVLAGHPLAVLESGGELPTGAGDLVDGSTGARARVSGHLADRDADPPSAGTSSIHTLPGGQRELAGPGARASRRVEAGLLQVPRTIRPSWNTMRVALAVELRLRHRVPGRVEVAGVADLHPQHQQGVGRELVALRRRSC